MKIAFVGPPASGKTTLALTVTAQLKLQYNAEIAPEFARTYILQNGGIQDAFEQYLILRKQKQMEDILASRHDIVVCDSATFLCYIYARRLVDYLSDRYLNVLELIHRESLANYYNLVFYLDAESTHQINDNVRIHTAGQLAGLGTAIRGFMDAEGIKYFILKGNLQERTDSALRLINQKLDERQCFQSVA
ncbi:hypothetical protein MTAT_19650 [Moorella thermoacetica]|uniref:NadR/Ttd14 AAA domain-containing protein n=1 Tax=Neomoorella thermoacetica TaxID=1525 RepID=A0AAC9HJ58_NEOTH|nr:ATP-binding protein [Moorella thermoacetica]AOQ24620.1 hypothetical protein Maut_02192 [Moorella thermoacetica]TYL12723.1 hypothetical protein MTAT_19650 [Moorella thermoacetica]